MHSDWQPSAQHFLPQLGGARRLQRVVEHAPDLCGLCIEQFDQILGAVIVACQRWLQVVNVAGQHGFKDACSHGRDFAIAPV